MTEPFTNVNIIFSLERKSLLRSGDSRGFEELKIVASDKKLGRSVNVRWAPPRKVRRSEENNCPGLRRMFVGLQGV